MEPKISWHLTHKEDLDGMAILVAASPLEPSPSTYLGTERARTANSKIRMLWTTIGIERYSISRRRSSDYMRISDQAGEWFVAASALKTT